MSKYYKNNVGKVLKQNSKNIDGIQMLANAIVLQAAKDYRELCRKIEKNPNNHEARREIKMIEDFFLNGSVDIFTAADGATILKKLKEQLRNERKSNNCNK